jgi:hypothetical protein
MPIIVTIIFLRAGRFARDLHQNHADRLLWNVDVRFASNSGH